MSQHTLHCFYDMAVSPCSFDFFTFFISAEICRKRRGLASLKLYMIHGPNNKFRKDTIRSDSQNENHFLNVILPGISLIPSCEGFFWTDREAVAGMNLPHELVFPRGYKPMQPKHEYLGMELIAAKVRGDEPGYIQAPEYAQDLAKKFIQTNGLENGFVTLTARELPRDDASGQRRLNIKAWQEIISSLDKNGIRTVVVRDTSEAFNGAALFDNAIEIPTASIHLPFRVALYSHASLNLTKNNGPGCLHWFIENRSLFFNHIDPDVVALTEQWYARLGFGEGSGGPMMLEETHYIWRPEGPWVIDLVLQEINKPKPAVYKAAPFMTQQNIDASYQQALNHLARSIAVVVMKEDRDLFKALRKMESRVTGPANAEAALREVEGQHLRPGTVDLLLQP